MVDSGCGRGGGWKSSLGKSILSAPFFSPFFGPFRGLCLERHKLHLKIKLQ